MSESSSSSDSGSSGSSGGSYDSGSLASYGGSSSDAGSYGSGSYGSGSYDVGPYGSGPSGSHGSPYGAGYDHGPGLGGPVGGWVSGPVGGHASGDAAWGQQHPGGPPVDPYQQPYPDGPHPQPGHSAQGTPPAMAYPYPGHPSYGYDNPYGYGYGYAQPPVDDRMRNQAVGALVVNICLLLFCCGIPSIAGIVVSAIAMARALDNRARAKTLIAWAWGLAIVSVLLPIGFIAVVLVADVSAGQ